MAGPLLGLFVGTGKVTVPLPDPLAVIVVLVVGLVDGKGGVLPSPLLLALPVPVGPGAGLSVPEGMGYGGVSFCGFGGRFMSGWAGMIMVTIELVVSL